MQMVQEEKRDKFIKLKRGCEKEGCFWWHWHCKMGELANENGGEGSKVKKMVTQLVDFTNWLLNVIT